MTMSMKIEIVANDDATGSFLDNIVDTLKANNELLKAELARAYDHIEGLEAQIEEISMLGCDGGGISDYTMRQITAMIEEAVNDAVNEAVGAVESDISDATRIDTFEPNPSAADLLSQKGFVLP